MTSLPPFYATGLKSVCIIDNFTLFVANEKNKKPLSISCDMLLKRIRHLFGIASAPDMMGELEDDFFDIYYYRPNEEGILISITPDVSVLVQCFEREGYTFTRILHAKEYVPEGLVLWKIGDVARQRYNSKISYTTGYLSLQDQKSVAFTSFSSNGENIHREVSKSDGVVVIEYPPQLDSNLDLNLDLNLDSNLVVEVDYFDSEENTIELYSIEELEDLVNTAENLLRLDFARTVEYGKGTLSCRLRFKSKSQKDSALRFLQYLDYCEPEHNHKVDRTK